MNCRTGGLLYGLFSNPSIVLLCTRVIKTVTVFDDHDRAESCRAPFPAGQLAKAKQSALAAKTAYRAVQKFLPKLEVQGKERELIAVKLGKLTHLIEKLSVIK